MAVPSSVWRSRFLTLAGVTALVGAGIACAPLEKFVVDGDDDGRRDRQQRVGDDHRRARPQVTTAASSTSRSRAPGRRASECRDGRPRGLGHRQLGLHDGDAHDRGRDQVRRRRPAQEVTFDVDRGDLRIGRTARRSRGCWAIRTFQERCGDDDVGGDRGRDPSAPSIRRSDDASAWRESSSDTGSDRYRGLDRSLVKFARIVFIGAGIWGLAVLAPLYWLVDISGRTRIRRRRTIRISSTASSPSRPPGNWRS